MRKRVPKRVLNMAKNPINIRSKTPCGVNVSTFFLVLLITFNLPGPSFFFTYQHSQKKNEKPKYTLKTRKYNLTLRFQAKCITLS